jgi:hypothetical protein
MLVLVVAATIAIGQGLIENLNAVGEFFYHGLDPVGDGGAGNGGAGQGMDVLLLVTLPYVGGFAFRKAAVFQAHGFEITLVVGRQRLLDDGETLEFFEGFAHELVFKIILGDLAAQAGVFLVLDDLQAQQLKVGVQGHHGLDEGLEPGKLAGEQVRRAPVAQAGDDHGVGEVGLGPWIEDSGQGFLAVIGGEGRLGRERQIAALEKLSFQIEYDPHVALAAAAAHSREHVPHSDRLIFTDDVTVDLVQLKFGRRGPLRTVTEQAEHGLLHIEMFVLLFGLGREDEGRADHQAGQQTGQGQGDGDADDLFHWAAPWENRFGLKSWSMAGVSGFISKMA